MTRLVDVVATAHEMSDDDVVYAMRPWTSDCEAAAVRFGEEDAVVTELENGMRYLLEAPVVREVIEVWSVWRGGVVPTCEQACDAVLYYGTWDAFQPVDPPA